MPKESRFFYGWIVLGVAVLGRLISGPGQTFAISVFVDPMMEDLGLSRTTVSAIYTAGSIAAGFTMAGVGYLIDRLGSRILMTVAGVLLGIAAGWMSLVDNSFELFVGFLFLRILGQGSLTLIPTTLIALWFVRLRGRAMAVGTLGVAAAQGIFPPLNHFLITQYGWRNAWLFLALMIWGVLLLPSALLVRSRPEDIQLLPDGAGSASLPQQGEDPLGPAHEVHLNLREATRTRAFWLLLIAGWSNPLIATALTFHQISLLEGRGISAGTGAAVFTVLAPMMIVGTFASGFLTERFSDRKVLVAGQLLLAATILWLVQVDSPFEAYTYGGLLGLSSGLLMNTFSVIWPDYFGRTFLGRIRGVASTNTVIAAAVGPLPFGVLYDLSGDYTLALSIFTMLPLLCAIASFFAVKPVEG